MFLKISEKISRQTDTAQYEFVVSDAGIGMKLDFLDRVFELFERADDSKIQVVQGTGLELSICKSIAKLMDGTGEAESQYGKGS